MRWRVVWWVKFRFHHNLLPPSSCYYPLSTATMPLPATAHNTTSWYYPLSTATMPLPAIAHNTTSWYYPLSTATMPLPIITHNTTSWAIITIILNIMPHIKSRPSPSESLPIHYLQVTHHAAVYSARISHFPTCIMPTRKHSRQTIRASLLMTVCVETPQTVGLTSDRYDRHSSRSTAPPAAFWIYGKAIQHQILILYSFGSDTKTDTRTLMKREFPSLYSQQPANVIYVNLVHTLSPCFISILILSPHLRTGFTSGLFFQGVSYQNLISISHIIPACRRHHIFQPLSIHYVSNVQYIKTTKLLITNFASVPSL
jgi:hypothetical protein